MIKILIIFFILQSTQVFADASYMTRQCVKPLADDRDDIFLVFYECLLWCDNPYDLSDTYNGLKLNGVGSSWSWNKSTKAGLIQKACDHLPNGWRDGFARGRCELGKAFEFSYTNTFVETGVYRCWNPDYDSEIRKYDDDTVRKKQEIYNWLVTDGNAFEGAYADPELAKNYQNLRKINNENKKLIEDFNIAKKSYERLKSEGFVLLNLYNEKINLFDNISSRLQSQIIEEKGHLKNINVSIKNILSQAFSDRISENRIIDLINKRIVLEESNTFNVCTKPNSRQTLNQLRLVFTSIQNISDAFEDLVTQLDFPKDYISIKSDAQKIANSVEQAMINRSYLFNSDLKNIEVVSPICELVYNSNEMLLARKEAIRLNAADLSLNLSEVFNQQYNTLKIRRENEKKLLKFKRVANGINGKLVSYFHLGLVKKMNSFAKDSLIQLELLFNDLKNNKLDENEILELNEILKNKKNEVDSYLSNITLGQYKAIISSRTSKLQVDLLNKKNELNEINKVEFENLVENKIWKKIGMNLTSIYSPPSFGNSFEIENYDKLLSECDNIFLDYLESLENI